MRAVTFLTLLLSIDSSSSQALQWISRQGYPGEGRHHPITFANESHAFLLTGSHSEQTATSDMYLYSEADNTWTTLDPFPGPARSFGYGVVLDDDYAYLGFGVNENGELLSDWWRFNMVTLEWKEMEKFPSYGRRHPAMTAVPNDQGEWKIHVGLGDGAPGNLKDWWVYDIDTDSWTIGPDFPSTARHHPYYFGLGGKSYVGLGHSDTTGFLEIIMGTPNVERDFFRFDEEGETWTKEGDFASYLSDGEQLQPATTEARVAGTQFSIEGSKVQGMTSTVDLGFVLSGDGADHGIMSTGEFHAFVPQQGETPSFWLKLPSHPGNSRWAPGSFVMRGSARAYFTSGFDRLTGEYYSDLWTIDLSPLFATSVEVSDTAEQTPSVPAASPSQTEETPTLSDSNVNAPTVSSGPASSAQSHTILSLTGSMIIGFLVALVQ